MSQGPARCQTRDRPQRCSSRNRCHGTHSPGGGGLNDSIYDAEI